MVSYGVDGPNEPLTPLALACVRHCPCMRFVFIFLAIFCISCRILPYRCGPYVFLFWGFLCTLGALRPRYNLHHLEKHHYSRLHRRGIACAEEEKVEKYGVFKVNLTFFFAPCVQVDAPLKKIDPCPSRGPEVETKQEKRV